MLPYIIGGLSILGGHLRANAARRAAAMQAAQDEYNAQLAELAAGDALQRGKTEEGRVRMATSERVSSDKAQLGASGVDVQSGSALDVLSGQRARGELAALITRSNATRQAWGYTNQAKNFRLQGAYALEAGDAAARADLIGGALGGAGVAYPVLRIGEPTVFEQPSWLQNDMTGGAGAT